MDKVTMSVQEMAMQTEWLSGSLLHRSITLCITANVCNISHT